MEDVDLYGLPDLWGILNYHVIDCKEISCPFALEFEDEQFLMENGRNIHRYVRYMRFKYTLQRLCGQSRVIIPDTVLAVLEYEGVVMEKERIWNSVRGILKQYKYKKYYDRIPCIIKELGYPGRIHISDTVMKQILLEFHDMSETFDELKRGGMMDIKYFPNLRFVALKLMEKHGVQIDYHIPFIRVKKVYEKLLPVLDMIGY